MAEQTGDVVRGHPLSRRRVLVTTAGAVGAVGIAACGDGGGGSAPGYGGPEPTGGRTSTGPTAAGSTPAASDGATTGAAGPARHELARLADVPVGGATAAEDSAGNPVIVAQPRSGEVVAFSAVCTHRGCTVAPDGGTLRCPCHGSTFDAATGDNTGGPAPEPLAEVRVSVVDGTVVEG